MSVDDLISVQRRRPGTRCTIKRFLEALPEDEAEDWRRHIYERDSEGAAIARAMRLRAAEVGVTMQAEDAVRRHRRNDGCSYCER